MISGWFRGFQKDSWLRPGVSHVFNGHTDSVGLPCWRSNRTTMNYQYAEFIDVFFSPNDPIFCPTFAGNLQGIWDSWYAIAGSTAAACSSGTTALMNRFPVMIWTGGSTTLNQRHQSSQSTQMLIIFEWLRHNRRVKWWCFLGPGVSAVSAELQHPSAVNFHRYGFLKWWGGTHGCSRFRNPRFLPPLL